MKAKDIEIEYREDKREKRQFIVMIIITLSIAFTFIYTIDKNSFNILPF